MSEKNKQKIYFSLGLLFLLIIVIKYSIIEPNKLDNNYRYTIGEITKKGVDAEGAFFADIEYYINHKKYSNSFSIQMEENKNYLIGAKYFIKYYPVNPDNATVELDLVVPKSITLVPPDGWKELPIDKDTNLYQK